MAFADRLKDFPLVLEVVPPHRRANEAAARKFVTRVREAVAEVPHLAAVNLPEVLDENHAGHPFYRHMSPRQCARLLNHHLGVDPIVNKVVVHLEGAEGFDAWARQSLREFGLRDFVFVGGNSSHVRYPGPTVPEANERLRAIAGDAPVSIGNITIPERAGEVERLLAKTRAGSGFFTTQVLFDPAPVSALLAQYGEACAREGLAPATVLLSFAPVSDYQDVELLAWLGAAIGPETEERLLAADREPGAASIEVTREIWTRIRDVLSGSAHPVPLGVNIEEISTHNFDLAVRMAKEFPSWRR